MTLKKIIATLLLAAPFAFAACNSENEYHRVAFLPNSDQGAQLIFADQTTDTLLLRATDPWTATQIGDWFQLEKTSENFQAGIEYLFKLPLSVQPNLTNKVRQGMVTVKASSEIMLPVVQVAWLNILSPVAQLEQKEAQGTVAKFVQYVHQDAGNATLKFVTYKDGATICTNDAWLTAPDTTLPAGYHEIRIGTALNPDQSERTGSLTLTSNGVSTPISFVQDGKKPQ